MNHLDLDDPRWFEFVRSCPDASPFHHPSWTAVLAECYDYRPMVLVLADDAGQISAGLPVMEVNGPFRRRRWVALPFTDYCPLLTKNQTAENLVRALVDEVRTRRPDALELRAGLPKENHLYTYTDHVRHTLALSPDLNSVYAQFNKSHRRNIRTAERAGVRIEQGHSASDVQMFYRLHLLTRHRLGVPIQPRRFFQLLAHRLIENGLGFVISAHVNREPVAAAIFLAWNGVLICKYSASDSRYWKCYPNNLLLWAAIRWGCENGYHTFDWGRTSLEDNGLRMFKNSLGMKEEPLPYSMIASAPPRRSSGWLEKALSIIIRRSPLWLCQAAGELLYRYAA